MPVAVLLTRLAGAGQEGSWLELDRQLAPPDERQESDFRWGALLRTFYTASDEPLGSGGTEEVSGLVFEDVDLHFEQPGEELSWRVSAEADSGELSLEDAHARWAWAEWFQVLGGQFRPRVVRSGSVHEEGLLFRERTFLGAAFESFDDGLELGGHRDQFDWWLALTDGSNGSQADHFWSARLEWALYDAAFADVEGARDAPDHLRVLFGLFACADVAQSSDDGDGFGLDLAWTLGPYSFHGEWATLDEQFSRELDVWNGRTLLIGDGDPFSVTLGRRLGQAWEAAARWQQADDADEAESLGFALDWCPGPGAVRWVADATRVESDLFEEWLLSIGLNVGSSGRPARPLTPRS